MAQKWGSPGFKAEQTSLQPQWSRYFPKVYFSKIGGINFFDEYVPPFDNTKT